MIATDVGIDDLLVAAENKNAARITPQATCVALEASHKDILRL